jgi:hypothetical protein
MKQEQPNQTGNMDTTANPPSTSAHEARPKKERDEMTSARDASASPAA